MVGETSLWPTGYEGGRNPRAKIQHFNLRGCMHRFGACIPHVIHVAGGIDPALKNLRYVKPHRIDPLPTPWTLSYPDMTLVSHPASGVPKPPSSTPTMQFPAGRSSPSLSPPETRHRNVIECRA